MVDNRRNQSAINGSQSPNINFLQKIGALDENGNLIWTLEFLKKRYSNFWLEIKTQRMGRHLHRDRFKKIFDQYPIFLSRIDNHQDFTIDDRNLISDMLKSKVFTNTDQVINNYSNQIDNIDEFINEICKANNFENCKDSILSKWPHLSTARMTGLDHGHLMNLFSVIKHLQYPNSHVVNYKYWGAVLGIIYNKTKRIKSYVDLKNYYIESGAEENSHDFCINMYIYTNTIQYALIREYIKQTDQQFEMNFIECFDLIRKQEQEADPTTFIRDYWKYFTDLFQRESINLSQTLDKPHQRIFFGAPGTGKSFKLNQEAKADFGQNHERVTFHPNYMYGNLVGTFKPFPKDDGSIIYKYVPGPLMRILVEALKNRRMLEIIRK